MSKHECCIWADADLGVDPTSKAILGKLAAVADDDDWSWMTIEELSIRVGASERTIQTRLRKLEGIETEADQAAREAAGKPAPKVYLRRTGEFHRMGTRQVPYYELMVDYPLVAEILERRKGRQRERAEARSMGATVCTHDTPDQREICTPMGATVCTPKREPTESQGSLTLTQGAGAMDAVVRELWDAWPAAGREHSSERLVADAVAAEVGEGAALADVRAGSLAYCAKPSAWGQSGGKPKSPHKFLIEGRWKTHLPKAAAPAQSRNRFADAEVRAALADAMGEPWVTSWLDPCDWDAGKRVVDPRLRATALGKLRETKPAKVFAKLGVVIGRVGS